MESIELKKLKAQNAKDKIMVALIDELATAKEFIEVNPQLTLKTVDEIISKRHPKFKLIDCKLTNMDEGTMMMEYDYEVVFEDTDNYILYGVKLRDVSMVNGEMWDDYVANEEDETFEVYKVIAHKVETIDYKFEKIK